MPLVSSTELRSRFSSAMSDMYRKVSSRLCSTCALLASRAITTRRRRPRPRGQLDGLLRLLETATARRRTQLTPAIHHQEVLLYGDLLDLVHDVNGPLLDTLSNLEVSRLNQERHGAIRVGKESELRNLARLFKLLGMFPVGEWVGSSALAADS